MALTYSCFSSLVVPVYASPFLWFFKFVATESHLHLPVIILIPATPMIAPPFLRSDLLYFCTHFLFPLINIFSTFTGLFKIGGMFNTEIRLF